MQETRVNNWSEFVDIANRLDGWAFRGQKKAEWQLWSAISRQLQKFCPDTSSWPEREQRVIRIFQRKAHNFLSDPRILEDELRCLALLQHHGAPTRLIDFTKSPYVAAFFALEDATEDSAVYAVNTPYLWHAAPGRFPELHREVIDPRERGNYQRYFIDNRTPLVWAGEPGRLDQRLVAQSGTFVMPGVLDRSIDDILVNEYQNGNPVLHKFILPENIREQAIQNLYRMNITYATLFPDLDGLARASALELEVMWKGLVSYPKD